MLQSFSAIACFWFHEQF